MTTWPPAVHTHDPSTSLEAITELTRSGKRATQALTVLNAVRLFPSSTCGELAREIGTLDRYQVARRLNDLLNRGYVTQGEPRLCQAQGSRQVTWNATPVQFGFPL